MAAVEDGEVEAAGEAVEDGPDPVEDAADLLHVPAHEDVGQAGRGRELPHVLLGRLGDVAQGQRVVHERKGGAGADIPEVSRGERIEGRAHRRLPLLQQVAAHEAGVRLGQLDERLPRAEVRHADRLDAPVRAAAPQDGQVEHQYTPSTTVDWKRENGRTFLTPSHG